MVVNPSAGCSLRLRPEAISTVGARVQRARPNGASRMFRISIFTLPTGARTGPRLLKSSRGAMKGRKIIWATTTAANATKKRGRSSVTLAIGSRWSCSSRRG